MEAKPSLFLLRHRSFSNFNCKTFPGSGEVRRVLGAAVPCSGATLDYRACLCADCLAMSSIHSLLTISPYYHMATAASLIVSCSLTLPSLLAIGCTFIFVSIFVPFVFDFDAPPFFFGFKCHIVVLFIIYFHSDCELRQRNSLSNIVLMFLLLSNSFAGALVIICTMPEAKYFSGNHNHWIRRYTQVVNIGIPYVY